MCDEALWLGATTVAKIEHYADDAVQCIPKGLGCEVVDQGKPLRMISIMFMSS
jgi:hypothetical protein